MVSGRFSFVSPAPLSVKTSSISLRVADFLKQHPPFEYLTQEERLRLANHGRVKFHESGEEIFTEGTPRGRFVWVIQRGTLNIYRPQSPGDELVDVRVEGDLLGIEWSDPTSPYLTTARVAQESILYALPADLFTEICAGNAEAQSYLQEYFSYKTGVAQRATEISNPELEQNAANWLTHFRAINDRAANRLLTAGPTDSIRAVAQQIAPGMQEAIAIVDEAGLPLGVVTEADLSAKVATGLVSVDAPVSEIMSSPVVTVRQGTNAGDLILEMMRRRRHHLLVTTDGTADTPVRGIIGEKTVHAMHGNMPVFLSKEFTLATDVYELRRLRDRADELLLRYVEGEAPIEWMTNFIAQVDRMVTEQAIVLAKETLASEGLKEPDIPWAWVALHSEGRKERLLRSSQRTGIVHGEIPNGPARESTVRWFSELANEMGSILSVCRFPMDFRGRTASNPRWCMPISGWQEQFRLWVSTPVESNIITLTPFFDMRAVTGDRSLVTTLRSFIREEVAANQGFIRLLGHDAMAHLPPVTVFRDRVLDHSGGVSDTINTKRNALTPLVDVARVFALSLGLSHATFTPDRYRRAAALLPQYESTFNAAAESFDHALRLQTRIGLLRGDSAKFVRPDELSRVEIQRIKSIFHNIARIMDAAMTHFNITDRNKP